jgi:hypothetical protein
VTTDRESSITQGSVATGLNVSLPSGLTLSVCHIQHIVPVKTRQQP